MIVEINNKKYLTINIPFVLGNEYRIKKIDGAVIKFNGIFQEMTEISKTTFWIKGIYNYKVLIPEQNIDEFNKELNKTEVNNDKNSFFGILNKMYGF